MEEPPYKEKFKITQVKVKLVKQQKGGLKALCSVVVGGSLLLRDLKVIETPNGLFVAMPTRRLTTKCPNCGSRNHVGAKFCSDCGTKLLTGREKIDEKGRPLLNIEIAHPITVSCNQYIQNEVLKAYQQAIQEQAQKETPHNSGKKSQGQ